VPYAKNARTHSPAQIDEIAHSINKFGWTMPILVDEQGQIIAGHGRVLAAAKMGLKTVPVMVAVGWTEQQKRAYTLADNQIALNADWNPDLLRAELSELQAMGTPLVDLGFSIAQIAEYTAPQPVPGIDPEIAPPLPKTPTSRTGDIWLLGRHRLMCGDATSKPDVMAVLGKDKPNLMVVDPPYGVNYDPQIRTAARSIGKVENDHQANWQQAWLLFPGNVAYVWGGGLHSSQAASSLESCGFRIRAEIIWVKTHPVMSRGNYHWQHEMARYAVKEGAEDGWRYLPEHALAAYAVKEGETANWQGDRKQSSVWFMENIKNETGHSTQKPIEAMRRPILNNSKPGDAVYDPFVGSGTTIIAAEMAARRAIAIEIMPGYVDVTVERWQELMGAKATLQGDGRTFDEVRQARLKSGKRSGGATKHAKSNNRKSVRRGNRNPGFDRPVDEPAIRKSVRKRQSQEGRSADSEPPALHTTGNPEGQ
jgi:DNA modification methylase